MLSPQTLRPKLESLLPQGLHLLESMVGINSFSANKDGVNKLARFTAESFAPLGFSAQHVPSRFPEFGDHLVLTRPGTSKRSIALVSHLDTVFPPEEELRNHFKWSREGDRIYGPGTNDIKGGTMMMWLVLEALRATSPEVFEAITWKLLWNSSEECFSPDFGDVCRAHFDSNTLAALIFEAEGRIGDERLMVVARKGRATWRATAHGRGAHAGSNHQQGANAIVQLGRVVDRIAALTDYSRDLTVTVGRIHGGTVLNRVPHEAVAEGELRAFRPEIFQQAKVSLLALSGKGDVTAKNDKYACEINIEIMSESRPWPRNAGTDGLYDIWQRAGERAGHPLGKQERGGLSDGNLIWDAVPTLDGLGPWGDNSHCSERSADGTKLPEYVEISSFVPKALANILAIEELARVT
jgi:glutamate carboxypeptidase